MSATTLRGITFAYDDAGSGDLVLLLVHGHPFSRSMWGPQIAASGALRCRVLAADLRGYGSATVTPGSVGLDAFAIDLTAFIDSLHVDRVVIAGLSMGGQIAMEFCRQRPERVRGLLLAATFPQPETAQGRVARRATAARLELEGVEQYAEELLPKMLSEESIATLPDVVALVRGMMRGTNPAGAAAALRGRAERPEYLTSLSRLHVPTSIVVGSADAYTTRQDAELMSSLIAGSELHWLEGIGHLPNLEAPRAFNEALSRLLDRIRD